MAYRQIHLTEKTLKKIAEALFLAYTAEQAAYLGGISERTLARIRKTEAWQKIEQKALELERPFRVRVWKGEPGWQGAAWMLERKYPGQLSRPEIQLSLNTGNTTTNNTIVITAEQAANLRQRNASLDQELQKLVPPASKARNEYHIKDVMCYKTEAREGQSAREDQSEKASQGDPINNNTDEKTLGDKLATNPASPTGTPYAPAREIEPNLPPKSKTVVNSSNSNLKTTSKSVENSKNSKDIPKGGIKRGRGRPRKVA